MSAHTHTHTRAGPRAAVHLVGGHPRQLAQVEVQHVQPQATGRLAAALQQLSPQQLQEPGNNAEQSHHTLSGHGGASWP